MKTNFAVRIVKFENLKEIPGVWSPKRFAALLEIMEYGDTSQIDSGDLRDMCVMSLQDLEPHAAAAILIEHELGDTLNKGQIQNAASEMLDEKLWEEFADFSLHERFFNIGTILYEAFPSLCPEPDAVQITIGITSGNAESRRLLSEQLDETLLVRLLADGMEAEATLHRLFSAQLAGARFPEASSLVWIVHKGAAQNESVTVEIISSGYWLDALRETRSYESQAMGDEADD